MNRKKLVVYIIGTGVMFFLLTFFISGKIGEDYSALLGAMLITKIQLAAMGRSDIPEEETTDYREKNSAIWALGQLGDKRALLFLQKYYTGYDSNNRTKQNEAISQYELYKAIKLSNGGFNVTAFIWR